MQTVQPPAPRTTPPPPPSAGTSTRKWVLRGIVGLLVLAVVGVAVAIGVVLFAASKIETIAAEDLESLTPFTGGTRTILVIGSDSRDDLPEGSADVFGDFSGERADVIMLVRVSDNRLQVLSLPRDLKVEIPGRGVDKLNAAFAYGGPDLMVDTVQQATGVAVNHYVEIGFGGFARMVDAVGGVTIDFPYKARDRKSGFAVEAGTQTLGGDMALAYARSRSYQELRNGEWTSVSADDIGRTERQQAILKAVFDQVDDPAGLFKLPSFATALGRSLTTDEGLTLRVMTGLATSAAGAGQVDTATLPVVISNEGGVSYVIRVEPDATSMVDAFADGDSMAAGGS